MKKNNSIYKYFAGIFLIFVLLAFISPDFAEARRGFGGFGRSFGGSRSFGRSFGNSRSFGGTRTFRNPQKSLRTPQTQPRTSFGNRRTSPPRMSASQRTVSSFGGQRLSSPKAYTQKYGTPRKSTPQSITRNGISQNYVMHSYGGYGSGLMMGYMMGTTSWLWMMPFHPAFYYSRPYYVDNPDGTVSVYPPTFSWSKLFFTLLVIGLIIYIIRVIIRSRKSRNYSQSSFS
jgi:hypothetical protein